MNTDTSLPSVYPRIINHVAVSVPDLKEAVNWYTKVLGFTVVKQVTELVADDSLKGRALKDIHGPKLKKMRMAWFSSANQVGFEIIEYVDPEAERRQNNFEFWKSGFIHICITDPNIEEMCKRIIENGGRKTAFGNMGNRSREGIQDCLLRRPFRQYYRNFRS